MENSNCGIYKITSPNGKVYIGSSLNICKRKAIYKGHFCKGQKKIYNSLVKYGFVNHTFEILEECPMEVLFEREVYYGELFDVLGNNGLNLALPKVDEIKTRLSDEAKENRLIANRKSGLLRVGIPLSNETKAKISESHKGKILSDEHKRAIAQGSSRNRSKLVIDLETGIFYNSIKEAAEAKGLIHSTLKNRVNGSSPTKTMIIYA